ncbi:site-specific DNA-methyltransferase [Herbaspirillum huttiense]|uniref:site-specific DNA-methyltransferase n=1 Tax=Herbaspirillum huttiense TaxID=863372 RepID=UPI002E7731B5|nr:site-specific DNA-methyltransferase [Herbaspirillum huttiense]MEE1636918.1 site-specific DNA-methyltransferase [Herbaspirillum huttiense NC40101]
MKNTGKQNLLDDLGQMSAPELRRLLTEHLTRQKLGLYWERNSIAHDKALNADVVLPHLMSELSHTPEGCTEHRNLIIEGDNFDSLRLLRATHSGKVRVIYIDPPYNTGNKDWVYNDNYVGKNDRWRHSQWLEFLFQRLVLARDLLTADGAILVSINDENRARLEMLMDEVFPGRRLGSFVWKTRSGSNDESGGRLSIDHEHVLVYCNPGFAFNGSLKDFSQYKNLDNDPRGRWKTGDLTQSKTYLERPNSYYPIQNPKTGIWYPCNPNRVWAFASETRVSDPSSLRAKTMEQYIREGKVIFPAEGSEEVVIWKTREELLNAISTGRVPVRPKTKTPLLTAELPDLDFWVGKPIGFDRPWFKRHLSDLQSEVRPVSSWVRGAVEEEILDEFTVGLAAQRSGTGEHSVNEILGFNAFPYPKPISLIKGLLAQATKPSDVVLDFFAGSGTTGQAVLELNAEDGGERRFILCSSTEANDKEPSKNLCRDVCAARIRRVIQGYGTKDGHSVAGGGEFAYLQLDKLDAADVALDATAEHAATLLTLRHAATVAVANQSGPIHLIAKSADWLMALCSVVNGQVLDQLCGLPIQYQVARLVVYAPRPKALAALLAERGVEAQVHTLRQALIQGQGGC